MEQKLIDLWVERGKLFDRREAHVNMVQANQAEIAKLNATLQNNGEEINRLEAENENAKKAKAQGEQKK